jgi:hypothetical protein
MELKYSYKTRCHEVVTEKYVCHICKFMDSYNTQVYELHGFTNLLPYTFYPTLKKARKAIQEFLANNQ